MYVLGLNPSKIYLPTIHITIY